MAEMGDVFPRPNLGPGDVWARQVMERIEGLERGVTGTASTLRSVQAGTTSALSSIVQQTPIIDKIERDQNETIATVGTKGRVFAQPEMPLPPDPRALWIDTDDNNTPYRGVEQSVEFDLESGTNPFNGGDFAEWDIVDGAGRSGSPALVNTNTISFAWNTDEVWERQNHVSFDMWVMFPTIAERVQGGALFQSDTNGDILAVILDTLSSGAGSDATLQVTSVSGAGSRITGTSPFTIVAGEWYHLQATITGNQVQGVVVDSDNNPVAEHTVGVPGVNTGYPGVYGYSVTAGNGCRVADYSASSARWDQAPDMRAREDAQQALQDAQDAINAAADAQTTADGKNAIYSGTSEPSGGTYKNGDLFLEQDGSGDVIAVKVWNGTAWAEYTLLADQVLVPSSVGAISIGDGAVTAPKIFAGAVTADKIAADAIVSDKIAAGAIFGEHIAAGTISANKLVLSDTSNLIPDAGFNSPLSDGPWNLHGYPWSVGYFSTPDVKGVQLLSGFNGSAALLTSGEFVVTAGDSLFFRADVYNDTDANTNFRVRWFDNSGGTVSTENVGNSGAGTASWSEISGSLTVPAGAVSAWVQILCQGPTAASTRLAAGGFQVIRRATAELIVDGSITADKIQGNELSGTTITGGWIDGGTITGNDISGGTIQTSFSGNRIYMDAFPRFSLIDSSSVERSIYFLDNIDGSPHLYMYDSTGTQRFVLSDHHLSWDDSGGATRVWMDSGGIFYWDADSDVNASIEPTSDNGQGLRLWGHNKYTNSSSFLELSGISGTGRWRTQGIYTNTVSSSANVHISLEGILYRSTSLRSAKVDIRDEPVNYGLLDIGFRSWLDRTELEQAGAGETPYPGRTVGAIAEEVAAAFPALATYDSAGKLNGVAYDRFGPALIPIIRSLLNRIESLEGNPITEWPDTPSYDDTLIWEEINNQEVRGND